MTDTNANYLTVNMSDNWYAELIFIQCFTLTIIKKQQQLVPWKNYTLSEDAKKIVNALHYSPFQMTLLIFLLASRTGYKILADSAILSL